MTAKQKISDLHAKFYGGGKKKADPVAKVVKTKAVDQVNAKLAKAGLPIQFVKAKGLKVKDAGPVINRKETDREIALRVAPELKVIHEAGKVTAKAFKSLPVSTLMPGDFHHVAGATRNEAMLMAKGRGIKNFRVLNLAELGIVLNTQDQKRIDEVVVGAVARWKSGWGKKSKVQK